MECGYARISTIEQNADIQLKALQRAGCKKIFTNRLTGATTKRPALLRCLKTLQDGDTLIVWKLDRLARSLRDLIAMLEDFDKRGIHFRSLTEEINTATPGGKLIFHIFGALAEFERGLIIERTREGMKAARARGVQERPSTQANPATDRPRPPAHRRRPTPRASGRPLQSFAVHPSPGACHRPGQVNSVVFVSSSTSSKPPVINTLRLGSAVTFWLVRLGFVVGGSSENTPGSKSAAADLNGVHHAGRT
jgi:DNA invertase Pin-like site-specific DNA recombinase